jgi:pyruvate dehydrogenase E1 component alpha subunit
MIMTDPDRLLEYLRGMVRIRRFEEAAAEQYSAGKIRGFLHLYIGEEAIAVGTIAQLEADDAIVSTYREHGHALARGITARAIMAEMFGKLEGCARGRGGSMHLFDAATRFYGGNAIVAGGLPVAVGLALGDHMQGRARVSACFFGDGAVAEGEFHESLNLAALWRLPVLFCCENNLYAMGTALDRCASEPDLARKAASYRMPAHCVDGMDVRAVAEASAAAVARIRAGGGPEFIEFRTYRFRAHSMFDAQLYRDKQEVEDWKQRDPIPRLAAELRELGALDDAALARLEAEIAAEVADAIAFAEAGTLEPVADLTRFVTTEIPTSPTSQERR